MLVGLGMLLLAADIGWKHMIPQSVFRTNQQAVDYVDSAAQYHEVTFAQGEGTPEYEQAREKYEAERAELDRARTMRDRAPFFLKAIGLLSAGIGIFLLLVHRIGKQP